MKDMSPRGSTGSFVGVTGNCAIARFPGQRVARKDLRNAGEARAPRRGSLLPSPPSPEHSRLRLDRKTLRVRDCDGSDRGTRAPQRFGPRALLRANRTGGRPDHSRHEIAAESFPGARPPRGNIERRALRRDLRDRWLRAKAAIEKAATFRATKICLERLLRERRCLLTGNLIRKGDDVQAHPPAWPAIELFGNNMLYVVGS
jgi:hypothetical protein